MGLVLEEQAEVRDGLFHILHSISILGHLPFVHSAVHHQRRYEEDANENQKSQILLNSCLDELIYHL